MSTRSRIGLQQADGKIKSVYCHWDGYPEGVGEILRKHYNSREKIEALLELGDISALGTFYDKELAKEKWQHEYEKEWRESEKGQKAQDLTLPYNDRGEDTEARIDENEEEFISKAGKCGEEYIYLFKEGYCWNDTERWFCMETPYFRELDEILEDKEEA